MTNKHNPEDGKNLGSWNREKTPPSEIVDFLSQIAPILARVHRCGDLKEMESWKKAFPDVTFQDVDYGLSGRKINWQDFSPVERAAYVVLWKDKNQDAQLTYFLSAPYIRQHAEISDSERLWSCWMNHVFANLKNPNQLPEEAIETLLYFAVQYVDFDELIESLLYNDEIDSPDDLEFYDEESYEENIEPEETDIDPIDFTHKKVI
jgi:hypothetical protein